MQNPIWATDFKFWREPFNHPDSFVKEIDSFLTTAEIIKTIKGNEEIYHVKFYDQGLLSQYGEFDLIKRDGFWKLDHAQIHEFTFLKNNIMGSIDIAEK